MEVYSWDFCWSLDLLSRWSFSDGKIHSKRGQGICVTLFWRFRNSKILGILWPLTSIFTGNKWLPRENSLFFHRFSDLCGQVNNNKPSPIEVQPIGYTLFFWDEVTWPYMTPVLVDCDSKLWDIVFSRRRRKWGVWLWPQKEDPPWPDQCLRWRYLGSTLWGSHWRLGIYEFRMVSWVTSHVYIYIYIYTFYCSCAC